MAFLYDYLRPALTVDIVVFGFREEALQVMLIQRGLPPFRGQWALPGGFVRTKEALDAAARTELEEETDEYEQNVTHRAARYYQFDKRAYVRLRKQGVNFEL